MEIRSYRRVFDLERRIYRVDRLRLNPGGVPIRGLLYFLAALLVALIAARLPILMMALEVLPWYLRDLALPVGIAAALTMIRIDGRPFHLAVQALVRYWVGSRHSVRRAHAAGPHPKHVEGWTGSSGQAPSRSALGKRWYPQEIVVLPDGSDARMRRLRYTGPGAVVVAVEHERSSRVIERKGTGLGRGGRRPALTMWEADGGRALSQARVISLAPGVRLLVRSARPRQSGAVGRRAKASRRRADIAA